MQSRLNSFHFLIIVLLGMILFIPFLGDVHLFDWDEINFAESAREMIVTGNYSKVQINYTPFWEKPPLFIWMQVISMKMFGVNEFAARFPNVIFGILTLCYIYYLGRKVFKGHLAQWWVLCYIGAITPHFYFKTGLIDPVFNFFIFCSIIQFYKAAKNYHASYNCNMDFMWAGILTGTAILAKGPVAFLIGLLVLFTIVAARRIYWFFSFKHLLIYSFSALMVSAIWFVPESIKNGPWFIIEFVNYQLGLFSQNIAGHQQPFYYHFLVLLAGCFPVSIIAISGWKRNEYYTYPENFFRLVMMCLFWVVLILFSIVKTKIVHYSSLCWLPLTFMAAYAIESFNEKVFRFRWYYSSGIIVFGLLVTFLMIAMPLALMEGELKEQLIQSIGDAFTQQNIKINGGWRIYDLLPGILLLIVLVAFVVFIIKENTIRAFGTLLIGNVAVIFLAAAMLVPKVEKQTQHTAIAFFETLQGRDVYIFNVGYKSYAPFFYARTQPLRETDGLNRVNLKFLSDKHKSSIYNLSETERAELDDVQRDWLLYGNIDKPAYFIAKVNDEENLPDCKNLRPMFNRGGFVTYERSVPEH